MGALASMHMAPLAFFVTVFAPPVALGLAAVVALKGATRFRLLGAASLLVALATLALVVVALGSGCLIEEGTCNQAFMTLALAGWVGSAIGFVYWPLALFVISGPTQR